MFDERSGILTTERPSSPERFGLEGEYKRCLTTLNRTGVVSILPTTESLGVVGFDGKEYPVPSVQEVDDVFAKQHELVTQKTEQGFTRLQLTPFAAPLSVLSDRVREVLQKHALTGKILQAKRNTTDPDIPVRVNQDDPVWTWDPLKDADTSGALVYFPSSYDRNHHGLTKDALVTTPSFCAVPGWSISLVEADAFLAQEGRGATLGGRKQLETNYTPQEYLQTLRGSSYKGETGFTPEDLLIDFLTRLHETNQVSRDWDDHSASFLTGSYLTTEASVPYGDWYRGDDQLGLDTDPPDYCAERWGASSTVRLSL